MGSASNPSTRQRVVRQHFVSAGYQAQLDEFIPQHRLLLVSVVQGIKNRTLYDAARYAWPINRAKAERIDLVLACVRGVVKGVYAPIEFLNASSKKDTEENFSELLEANPGFVPAHSDSRQRLGFIGKVADEETNRRYVGKLVPDRLKIGQNGFRYSGPD